MQKELLKPYSVWEQILALPSVCGPPYHKIRALQSGRVWVTLYLKIRHFCFVWSSKAFLAANVMYRSRNCSWHINPPVPNQSLNLTSGRHREGYLLFPFCCAVALNTLACGFCLRKISEESHEGLLLSSNGLKRKKTTCCVFRQNEHFIFAPCRLFSCLELSWCVLSLFESTFKSLEKLLKALRYLCFFPFEKKYNFFKVSAGI